MSKFKKGFRKIFRGAQDGDPETERKEVDLAQAIIDLHKVDPKTGEIVDVNEDEDKAAEVRKVVEDLSGKLEPEEIKRLTDALSGLAYAKATGDEEPEENKEVLVDKETKKAMDACGLDSEDEETAKAFSEGMKYAAQDTENEAPEAADGENTIDGESAEDDDKAAELAKILDAVEGLTPDQRGQIEASILDFLNGGVADENPEPGPEATDEELTQDRALRKIVRKLTGGKRGKVLMAKDAATIQARAVAGAKTEFRNIATAVRDVRTLVGELDYLAFDSATDVYGYALEACGVNPRKYSRSAWRGMVDMLRREKAGLSGNPLAQDRRPAKLDGPFAGLNSITVG